MHVRFGSPVLFWEGGRNGDMYVKLEATSVIAQDYQYDNAYTSRSLAAGIGTERYMWKDFDTPKNIKEIEALIERQNEVINTLSSVPIGTIQISGGHPAYTAIPDGYLTCRGQALNKNEYTKLYDVIGDSYTPPHGDWKIFNLPYLQSQLTVTSNSEVITLEYIIKVL